MLVFLSPKELLEYTKSLWTIEINNQSVDFSKSFGIRWHGKCCYYFHLFASVGISGITVIVTLPWWWQVPQGHLGPQGKWDQMVQWVPLGWTGKREHEDLGAEGGNGARGYVLQSWLYTLCGAGYARLVSASTHLHNLALSFTWTELGLCLHYQSCHHIFWFLKLLLLSYSANKRQVCSVPNFSISLLFMVVLYMQWPLNNHEILLCIAIGITCSTLWELFMKWGWVSQATELALMLFYQYQNSN